MGNFKELRVWQDSILYIANHVGYIDTATLENLEDKTEKIRASLKKLIKTRSQ